MIQLKICGMKQPENILQVAGLKPNYLGFIFYGPSPRNFTGQVPEIDNSIKRTGVFVNSSHEEIKKMITRHSLSAIQLHGEESPDLCQALRGDNTEVIKVFSMKESFDFQLLQAYEGKVDFFLFDTFGKTKGGTGMTFNWDLLRNYPSLTPFFLSGGIGIEEIDDIFSLYQHLKTKNNEDLLYAIDVNSRFESEPGIKIFKKLKRFQEELDSIEK